MAACDSEAEGWQTREHLGWGAPPRFLSRLFSLSNSPQRFFPSRIRLIYPITVTLLISLSLSLQGAILLLGSFDSLSPTGSLRGEAGSPRQQGDKEMAALVGERPTSTNYSTSSWICEKARCLSGAQPSPIKKWPSASLTCIHPLSAAKFPFCIFRACFICSFQYFTVFPNMALGRTLATPNKFQEFPSTFSFSANLTLDLLF